MGFLVGTIATAITFAIVFLANRMPGFGAGASLRHLRRA